MLNFQDHQKWVFHKMMNQWTPVWKTTNKLERQLKNKENKQKKQRKKIQQLEKLSKRQKPGPILLKDKKRRKNKEKLKQEKTRENEIKKRNKRNKQKIRRIWILQQQNIWNIHLWHRKKKQKKRIQ